MTGEVDETYLESECGAAVLRWDVWFRVLTYFLSSCVAILPIVKSIIDAFRHLRTFSKCLSELKLSGVFFENVIVSLLLI